MKKKINESNACLNYFLCLKFADFPVIGKITDTSIFAIKSPLIMQCRNGHLWRVSKTRDKQ